MSGSTEGGLITNHHSRPSGVDVHIVPVHPRRIRHCTVRPLTLQFDVAKARIPSTRGPRLTAQVGEKGAIFPVFPLGVIAIRRPLIHLKFLGEPLIDGDGLPIKSGKHAAPFPLIKIMHLSRLWVVDEIKIRFAWIEARSRRMVAVKLEVRRRAEKPGALISASVEDEQIARAGPRRVNSDNVRSDKFVSREDITPGCSSRVRREASQIRHQCTLHEECIREFRQVAICHGRRPDRLPLKVCPDDWLGGVLRSKATPVYYNCLAIGNSALDIQDSGISKRLLADRQHKEEGTNRYYNACRRSHFDPLCNRDVFALKVHGFSSAGDLPKGTGEIYVP